VLSSQPLPEIITRNYYPKSLSFPETITRDHYPKLLPEAGVGDAGGGDAADACQAHYPKLLPEIIVITRNCYPKLLPETITRNCYPKQASGTPGAAMLLMPVKHESSIALSVLAQPCTLHPAPCTLHPDS
jgi:hypothetical protein